VSTTPPTLDLFVQAFPELVTANPGVIEYNLELCSAFWSVQDWGQYYSNVVLLDTAHRVAISLARQAGASGGFQVPAGPVNSVSAAGITTSFQVQALDKLKAGSREWYQVTSYGRELIRLRDNVISPAYTSC
jgi:hypothetical protein